MAGITLDQTARDNGLAAMIRDLITQNIANHPERAKDLQALNGNIGISAGDIEVSLTLQCKEGTVVIYDGIQSPCKLLIATDSDNILKLSTLKIKAGLPYYFDKTGREILGMLFNGKLKIQGLLAHLVLLTRVTRLFSVY